MDSFSSGVIRYLSNYGLVQEKHIIPVLVVVAVKVDLDYFCALCTTLLRFLAILSRT
jgi:hypothetical protein